MLDISQVEALKELVDIIDIFQVIDWLIVWLIDCLNGWFIYLFLIRKIMTWVILIALGWGYLSDWLIDLDDWFIDY